MKVQGIHSLYEYAKRNGWEKLTEIVNEPWGAKTCSITTPDEYVLRFFE